MSDEQALRAQILALTRELCELRLSQAEFLPGETPVAYAGRVYDSDEMTSLVDASLDFWLTAGRFADRFEAEFAHYFDAMDAILVNSGSSANLVALSTLTSPKLGDRRLKRRAFLEGAPDG